MSTVNAMSDVQTGQEVVPSEHLPSELTEPKFSADQVEKKCPDRLRQIGKLIVARLEKIDKQIEQAENHSISVNQLIAQAKDLCDEGGFNAFREMFFPNLGKSRVYELLAIGTNKKSFEEIKASTRARVAKHRANRAELRNSVTVTENSAPDVQGAPKEHGEIDDPSISPEQPPEPASRKRAVAPGDEAERAFTIRVMELDRTTVKRPPKRFFGTGAPVEVLARVGKLLSDVADGKKSDAAGSTAAAVPSCDDAVSAAGRSAENTKAERPTLDAEEVRR